MSFQVIEHRCKGGAKALKMPNEQAAVLYFLEQAEFALRTWQDTDVAVHLTEVVLIEVNGHVDTIGSMTFRCHHKTESRARRA